MQLKLVLKGPERLMGADLEKTMEGGSLTIGRSPTADWILPDPDRILSKVHCRIDKDISGFVLVDTSTNGVRLNDEPLGFGLPRLLADGDVLKLGDAVMLVRLKDQASQPPALRHETLGIAISDGPFGMSEPNLVVNESVFPANESIPAAAPGRTAEVVSEKIRDDWWTSQEPFETFGKVKTVDISTKETQGKFDNTNLAPDPLPLQDGDAVKLAASLVGLDLSDLARAVDMAAAALSESERDRFHERLRDLLIGNYTPRA